MIKGILLCILGDALTYMQMQGQFKYEWIKNNSFIVALFGVPICYIYLNAVSNLYNSLNDLWACRLLTFSISTIVFAVLSRLIFDQHINAKTLICLILSFTIILIQFLWK